jgi:hypothetical protein
MAQIIGTKYIVRWLLWTIAFPISCFCQNTSIFIYPFDYYGDNKFSGSRGELKETAQHFVKRRVEMILRTNYPSKNFSVHNMSRDNISDASNCEIVLKTEFEQAEPALPSGEYNLDAYIYDEHWSLNVKEYAQVTIHHRDGQLSFASLDFFDVATKSICLIAKRYKLYPKIKIHSDLQDLSQKLNPIYISTLDNAISTSNKQPYVLNGDTVRLSVEPTEVEDLALISIRARTLLNNTTLSYRVFQGMYRDWKSVNNAAELQDALKDLISSRIAYIMELHSRQDSAK